MGRGRAKAKQTKVARQLKYSSGGTDLSRLANELGASPSSQPPNAEPFEDDDEEDDPYAQYADLYNDDEDEDEDDKSGPSSQRRALDLALTHQPGPGLSRTGFCAVPVRSGHRCGIRFSGVLPGRRKCWHSGGRADSGHRGVPVCPPGVYRAYPPTSSAPEV